MKVNFKKIMAMLLTLSMLSVFVACNNGAANNDASSVSSDSSEVASAENNDEKIDLVVFAAASLTESLTAIGNEFMKENKNVNVVFNFDSSGTLKTQIEEGADCDIFISAAEKQMNQLDINQDTEVNPDRLDFVDSETRVNLLENKVVLTVPNSNSKNINSFDDLKAAFENENVLMAMGNSDVPVGQYTQKILNYLGLDEESLANKGLISYGSNVKEVTSQVTEASVDCGIVYKTDAFSAGLTVVSEATAEMCGQVVYPAAVLKTAKNADAAKSFMKYLKTAKSVEAFEAVGFTFLG